MDFGNMLSERGKERSITLQFWGILLTGLVLRIYQYTMGRSLGEDEANVALNFIYNGYVRLLSPLNHCQVAPVLFLWGVKTFTKLFGFSELVLRALPFLVSLLTLPLFYFVIIELTGRRLMALMGFLIFSLNLAAIYFSSELKPYALDLSCFVLLLYLALSKNNYVSAKRALLLAIAGGLSLLISNVSFVILFCIGLNIVSAWLREKRANKQELLLIGTWVAVFLLNYFQFNCKHPFGDQLQNMWGFACPTDLFSGEFAPFVKTTGNETCFTGLLHVSKDFGFTYFLFLIFLVGLVHLVITKKRQLLLYACLPVLIHLALSALHMYPSGLGFILYLIPCFIIIMAEGAAFLIDYFSKKFHQFAGIAFGIICCAFFVKSSVTQYPLWPYEIRPAIQFVNQVRPLGTHVYIFDPANAFKYYMIRGTAQKPIFMEVPSTIKTDEFYSLVAPENSEYILFSSDATNLSYMRVVENLQQKGLVIKNFSYKTYAVNVVRPAPGSWRPVVKEFDYKSFDPALTFKEDLSVAIWDYQAVSQPQDLPKGNYEITVLSRGTPVKGVFPHHKVFINDTKIGEFSNSKSFKKTKFYFEQQKDTIVRVRIVMDNDRMEGKEDINSFIKSVQIKTAE